MTAPSSTPAPTPTTPTLSRRHVLAGAAWAVPAIVTVTATPAFAATSSDATTTVTTPNMQAPASGTVVVTAVVTNASGQPLAGQSVAFSGPAGSTFSPDTATTDGSGIATSTLTTADAWALPGSSVTVTALSNGASGTAPLTVLGANAYSVGANWSDATPGTRDDNSVAQLRQDFPSPIVAIASSLAAGERPLFPDSDTYNVPRVFTLALLRDGTVWAVGSNAEGQLGDGTTIDRATWAPIPGLFDVKQISTQEGTGYALLSDGTIRSWGSNAHGSLGNGTDVSFSTTPVAVSDISTATRLGNGIALLADGTIRTWGSGYAGRLGNGSGVDHNVPVAVTGIDTAVRVAANAKCGFAVLADGSVRAWGANQNRELGDGTTELREEPVSVLDISTAVDIACAGSSAYALLSDGTIRAWGINGYGQLGDGTTEERTAPVAVKGISTAVAITGTSDGGFALLNDGTITAWGGAPGIPDSGPGTITGTQNVTTLAANGYTFTGFFIVGERVFDVYGVVVEAGGDYNYAYVFLKNAEGENLVGGQIITMTAPSVLSVLVPDRDGNFVHGNSAVSRNPYTLFGLAAPDPWTTPGTTLDLTVSSAGASAIAPASVVGANAYAVGANDFQESGTPSSASVLSEPTQLRKRFWSPITAAASGRRFSVVLLSSGQVLITGDNRYGQHGAGSNDPIDGYWTLVDGIDDAVGIAVAGDTCIALLSSGSVVQWGRNLNPHDDDSFVTTPTPVDGITDAIQIAGSSTAFFALRPDGTVLAWGYNETLEFGVGWPVVYRSSPEAVPNLSNVVEVQAASHTVFARLSTGEVYSWGSNDGDGTLGNGTANEYTEGSVGVPMQMTPGPVTGIDNAIRIAAGPSTGYALLATGQIVAWGGNSSGEVGDGTTDIRRTPVPVSGIANAVTIGAGYYCGYAILADGTSRAWGNNELGQLGDGTTTSQSAPIPLLPQGRPLKGFSTSVQWASSIFITVP
ncbi:Ig-like domain-containing protein [Microbacterium sp. NPDC089190]|uniref:Ig-like domain-containing protein n=1 Tax=Microbacterium sp. NPDC089190 TaxID=3155063 RepID=UPI00344DF259